ncbi:MAG: L-2-hydroxyglutarate oxidase [Chitinophagales bacterium]|nr:L-2-hydroxyglutarate oxidase [Bacteroidota bacterium]MCB9043303.1 L-2-hydroxyglutarate oxidase [Chitinophagales bacterium]
MNVQYDIAIVGGGIVGLATAYQLSLQYKERNLRIVVFEKEPTLAFHQTGHNSGVIHSGIYYKPGSLRAQNCYEGRHALVRFCKEQQIPFDICGKVIVASKESELPYLQEIYDKGIANKTEDIELIEPEQIREIEPYCDGIKAIRVGCAGIVDYQQVAQRYADLFVANGGEIKTNCLVKDFERKNDITTIITSLGNFDSRYVIACGGAQSDRLAKKYHLDPGMRIVGFRGEYYELLNHDKVKNLIYPVPDPNFPWLGVHFTRMIQGEIECGPNAVFAFKREGYEKTDFDWQDTKDALSYSGFWQLTRKHLAFGIAEQYRSISKAAFHKSLLHLIPSLQMDEIAPGRSGVRALALTPEGSMIDDFKFVHADNAIHVLNAPSPAATASLAIGKTIADMAKQKFNQLV